MIGPIDSAKVLIFECTEKKVYDCDYKDKIVLDVGAFCGETAVFFYLMGAKKVVIYEPVLDHHKYYSKILVPSANRLEF